MTGQTSVIYNGVNWRAFADADGEGTRRELGLTDSQIVLLFAGVLDPKKGVLQLLEAFRILSQQCKDVHLLLAGSESLWSHIDCTNGWCSYETRLREAAAGLPVTFLGSVPYEKMPKLHKAVDILILPSVVQDANPPVVLEAMAAGKPVVASKVGGVPELVMDGETGLLVEARNVPDLVGALNTLIRDPDLRSRLGIRGQTVARQFDWEVVSSQLMGVYRSVV
jgi:glycosyltransferase involved in cell wall biosynthesis